MPPETQRSGRLAARDPLNRYFVSVQFAGVKHANRILEYGMDLFEESVVPTEHGLRADGLLSVPEILRLVEDGWEVTIKAPAHHRTQAHDVSEFEHWLEQMGLK
jgi:hypothetical protein